MKRILLTLPLLFIPFSLLAVFLLGSGLASILNVSANTEPISSIISLLTILVLVSDVAFIFFLTIFISKDKGYNPNGYNLGLFLVKIIQIPLFIVSLFVWVIWFTTWFNSGAAPLVIIILFPFFIYLELLLAIASNIPTITLYIREMVRKELSVTRGIFSIIFSFMFGIDIIVSFVVYKRVKKKLKLKALAEANQIE